MKTRVNPIRYDPHLHVIVKSNRYIHIHKDPNDNNREFNE